MKKFKVRIISSVVCLIAACVLAVVAVFAWFYTNQSAEAYGIDTQATSGEVIEFDAIPYQASSEDGVTYTLTDGENSINNMEIYSSSFGSGTKTAVIIKIKYVVTIGGTFELAARLRSRDVYDIENFKNFTNKNHLSNAVYLRELEEDSEAGTYNLPQKSVKKSFVNGVFDSNDNEEQLKEKKKDFVGLNEYEVKAEEVNESCYRYFLMDYDPELISSLYNTMLNLFPDDATLSTSIIFNQDIYLTFGLSTNQ